jgi:hypothetical protein
MASSLIVIAWPNPPSFPQDLSLYMNPCPFTVQQIAPLPRVFNLFRTMGTSQPLARRGGMPWKWHSVAMGPKCTSVHARQNNPVMAM